MKENLLPKVKHKADKTKVYSANYSNITHGSQSFKCFKPSRKRQISNLCSGLQGEKRDLHVHKGTHTEGNLHHRCMEPRADYKATNCIL
jgi:hypothetical protein